MIMLALAKYYDRLAEGGRVAPEGFERVEIPFLIVLNRSGEFVVFNFKNILFVVPPLVITEEQLDEGLNLLDEGLSELMDGQTN